VASAPIINRREQSKAEASTGQRLHKDNFTSLRFSALQKLQIKKDEDEMMSYGPKCQICFVFGPPWTSQPWN
jgi:hypothetical protein